MHIYFLKGIYFVKALLTTLDMQLNTILVRARCREVCIQGSPLVLIVVVPTSFKHAT
jgi:hypothetical protein